MLDSPRFFVSRNKREIARLVGDRALHRLDRAERIEPHVGDEPLEDIGLRLDGENARGTSGERRDEERIGADIRADIDEAKVGPDALDEDASALADRNIAA